MVDVMVVMMMLWLVIRELRLWSCSSVVPLLVSELLKVDLGLGVDELVLGLVLGLAEEVVEFLVLVSGVVQHSGLLPRVEVILLLALRVRLLFLFFILRVLLLGVIRAVNFIKHVVPFKGTYTITMNRWAFLPFSLPTLSLLRNDFLRHLLPG